MSKEIRHRKKLPVFVDETFFKEGFELELKKSVVSANAYPSNVSEAQVLKRKKNTGWQSLGQKKIRTILAEQMIEGRRSDWLRGELAAQSSTEETASSWTFVAAGVGEKRGAASAARLAWGKRAPLAGGEREKES